MEVELREALLGIGAAALAAVDPAAAVGRALSWEDATRLRVGAAVWELPPGSGVLLVAAGKAAVPMARAAAAIVGASRVTGVVVTKTGHVAGAPLPRSLTVLEAGHPVPDAAGLAAAEQVAGRLSEREPGHVLVLLSGGASALLPYPLPGVTLADLQALTDRLLRAGATIGELNTVRKHLDGLKGGRMARLAAGRELATLILSDVVGDPLEVIASGPTVPDPTTAAEARTVLARRGVLDGIPVGVRTLLAGGVAETPKPGDPCFARVIHTLVGSNRLAARAAAAEAERRGYRPLLLTTFMEGEARELGRVAAALVKGVQAHGDPLAPPACLIWGGESTVTVRGDGRGGRNLELALSAALALEGRPGFALLALATDGTDGPTDAGGAIVDGETLRAARGLGLDPEGALARNDSYPLLAAAGALLCSGPTGTNVNDLLICLVR